jgi:hypothetical protein
VEDVVVVEVVEEDSVEEVEVLEGEEVVGLVVEGEDLVAEVFVVNLGGARGAPRGRGGFTPRGRGH